MERSNLIGWAQVRAGIFIFTALLLIAGAVLLMGEKTKMFVPKGKLKIMMEDVAGLKEGAPVWLAGVDVGVVTAINFYNPRKSNEVEILLEADRDALHKIGADSVITIKTRGLMGEKYVDITPSQSYSDTPPDVLRGKAVTKLDDVIQQAGASFSKINRIVDNINEGHGTLGKLNSDETLYDNVAKLAVEMKLLISSINSGEGSIGKLSRSPEPYNRLMSILNRTDSVLQNIQSSDGTLNRLIYDRELYAKLVMLADKSVEAAENVRLLNRKLTSPESTIGMLVGSREMYDKGLSLLNRADNSLKSLEEIAALMNSGEGSLGKLINDRELYERTESMVGSMELLIKDIKEHPKRYFNFSLF